MADLQSFSSHSTNTHTRFFCKSLFFALCLLTIPLFPSQAPDFIDQNLITQFWELLHLLFVGIAVSYGLFCRRNVDAAAAAADPFVDPRSCGSHVFQVSSIFDDGYDCYSCGPPDEIEKAASQNWNWKSSESYPICEQDQVSGSVDGEEDLVQSWNSQYVRGDSVVVVAHQPNCNVDRFGWKPLGLPVRSLRSRVMNEVCSESNGYDELKCDKYGESLEKKSETTRHSSCFATNNQSIHVRPVSVDQIQFESLKSRSLRSSGSDEQKSDNTRPSSYFAANNQSINACPRSSHVRPVSVDQIKFESLRSRSLRSSGSSSQTSPVSNSPSSSPSTSRNMGEKGRSSGQLGGKGSLHLRHFSYGSSMDSRRKRGCEDELKEFSWQENDATLGADAKPAGLTKSVSRARSVRTFRAKRPNSQLHAVNHGRIEASEDFFSTISNYVPNASSLSEDDWIQKAQKPPRDDSGSECGQVSNLGLSSDEETVSQPVSDAAPAHDDYFEVDRKAGEFIAKFREQIKLQKMMASVETPRGSQASGHIF